jgi:hypothetical protein
MGNRCQLDDADVFLPRIMEFEDGFQVASMLPSWVLNSKAPWFQVRPDVVGLVPARLNQCRGGAPASRKAGFVPKPTSSGDAPDAPLAGTDSERVPEHRVQLELEVNLTDAAGQHPARPGHKGATCAPRGVATGPGCRRAWSRSSHPSSQGARPAGVILALGWGVL